MQDRQQEQQVRRILVDLIHNCDDEEAQRKLLLTLAALLVRSGSHSLADAVFSLATHS